MRNDTLFQGQLVALSLQLFLNQMDQFAVELANLPRRFNFAHLMAFNRFHSSINGIPSSDCECRLRLHSTKGKENLLNV